MLSSACSSRERGGSCGSALKPDPEVGEVPIRNSLELPCMPIADDVSLGEDVVIHHPSLVNLYGCVVGAGSRIGTFVEIQRGCVVGANCKT